MRIKVISFLHRVLLNQNDVMIILILFILTVIISIILITYFIQLILIFYLLMFMYRQLELVKLILKEIIEEINLFLQFIMVLRIIKIIDVKYLLLNNIFIR